MTCKPIQNTDSENVFRDSLEIDYTQYKSELVVIPLIGINTPKVGARIYFSDFGNLNGKKVVGINFLDSSTLSAINYGGQIYTAIATVYLRQCSLSIYDSTKDAYALELIPLATLISPSQVSSGMKYPFFDLDIDANLRKSFIQLNRITGLSTANALAINFYYKD